MGCTKTKSDRRFMAPMCLLAAAMTLWAGCGGPKEPPRFDLSGRVTYQGAVAPRHHPFRPRLRPGKQWSRHTGGHPGRQVPDGPGKGTIGGPHIAIIDGFDGIRPHEKTAGTHESGREKIAALGQPLFRSIHVKIDLPRQAATHDFVLPVE